MNCFMIYKRDKKHAILKDNPMINFRDISKIVADQWREETEEVKEHYKNLAKIEMKNHQEKYPDYRFPSSKGKHNKKKVSKLAMALTQELKKSVGRPKKVPQGVSQDKSEKLQEYIKRLKNINGIQFQDSSSGNDASQVLPESSGKDTFRIPDATDAIYKDRVLPPLVQKRGYLTPVKSEYFLPMSSKGSPGAAYSTPTTPTPMNRNMSDNGQQISTLGQYSPLLNRNMSSQQMLANTAQAMSSMQQMNRNMPVNGQLSSGAQQMNRNISQDSLALNRNLPVPGNMPAPAVGPQMPQNDSQQISRNMPVTVAQQMKQNYSAFVSVSAGAQQMPVTVAQQQQMNRTLPAPVSQQIPASTEHIMTNIVTSAQSVSSSPSVVSIQQQNFRTQMLPAEIYSVSNDQKDMIKNEEMVDRQIQRVGTPSTPVYSTFTSPVAQKPVMATPEQSPQNVIDRAQFRTIQPMAISEIAGSPNRMSSLLGNPSYYSTGFSDQAQMENLSSSPKRGRPRGASSPGQQYSFLCEICSSSFVRRHDLKRHLLLHSGLGPYRCSCGRHFSRQDFFARHLQTCRTKTIVSPPESPALSVDEYNASSQPL